MGKDWTKRALKGERNALLQDFFSTEIITQKLLHRNYYTEIITQKLLHRNYYYTETYRRIIMRALLMFTTVFLLTRMLLTLTLSSFIPISPEVPVFNTVSVSDVVDPMSLSLCMSMSHFLSLSLPSCSLLWLCVWTSGQEDMATHSTLMNSVDNTMNKNTHVNAVKKAIAFSEWMMEVSMTVLAAGVTAIVIGLVEKGLIEKEQGKEYWASRKNEEAIAEVTERNVTDSYKSNNQSVPGCTSKSSRAMQKFCYQSISNRNAVVTGGQVILQEMSPLVVKSVREIPAKISKSTQESAKEPAVMRPKGEVKEPSPSVELKPSTATTSIRVDSMLRQDVGSSILMILSHELKTPLNGLLGMLNLLSETSMDAEQKLMLKAALASADSLSALINDMFDMQSLIRNNLILSPEPCSILGLLRSVESYFRPVMKERGLNFNCLFPESGSAWRNMLLSVDHFRLQQILTALLSNSYKYNSVNGTVNFIVSCVGVCKHISITETPTASHRSLILQPSFRSSGNGRLASASIVKSVEDISRLSFKTANLSMPLETANSGTLLNYLTAHNLQHLQNVNQIERSNSTSNLLKKDLLGVTKIRATTASKIILSTLMHDETRTRTHALLPKKSPNDISAPIAPVTVSTVDSADDQNLHLRRPSNALSFVSPRISASHQRLLLTTPLSTNRHFGMDDIFPQQSVEANFKKKTLETMQKIHGYSPQSVRSLLGARSLSNGASSPPRVIDAPIVPFNEAVMSQTSAFLSNQELELSSPIGNPRNPRTSFVYPQTPVLKPVNQPLKSMQSIELPPMNLTKISEGLSSKGIDLYGAPATAPVAASSSAPFFRRVSPTIDTDSNDLYAQFRFIVADNGTGIKRDVLKNVFNLFHRSDSSLRRSADGAGIGLCLCARLAALMESKLEIQSEYGVGTTCSFCVDLPITNQPDFVFLQERSSVISLDKLEFSAGFTSNDKLNCSDESSPVQSLGVSSDKDEPIVRPTITFPAPNAVQIVAESVVRHPNANCKKIVLIVEDNLINMKVATMILQKIGFEVQHAVNGEEAVAVFQTVCLKQNVNFSFCLMDISMPIMDGFAATRAIRELESKFQRQRLPIIACSAHNEAECADEVKACGMDCFVSKPIDKSLLLTKITYLLNRDSPTC